MTATDAEACAYIYTRSLESPMDHDWTKIYLYVAGKVIARARNIQVPEDIKVESLTDDQMRDLQELKGWIYQQRVKYRQEKRRSEKAKTREEVKAKEPKQIPLLV